MYQGHVPGQDMYMQYPGPHQVYGMSTCVTCSSSYLKAAGHQQCPQCTHNWKKDSAASSNRLGIDVQTCAGCSRTLPIDAYTKTQLSKGASGRCKDCTDQGSPWSGPGQIRSGQSLHRPDAPLSAAACPTDQGLLQAAAARAGPLGQAAARALAAGPLPAHLQLSSPAVLLTGAS